MVLHVEQFVCQKYCVLVTLNNLSPHSLDKLFIAYM